MEDLSGIHPLCDKKRCWELADNAKVYTRMVGGIGAAIQYMYIFILLDTHISNMYIYVSLQCMTQHSIVLAPPFVRNMEEAPRRKNHGEGIMEENPRRRLPEAEEAWNMNYAGGI